MLSGKHDKDNPFGFLAKIEEKESNKIFSQNEDAIFSIFLIIYKVNKDVPVRWSLLWINNERGYGGVSEYDGTIPEESSPEHGKSGIYLEDKHGNRMTIFTMNAKALKKYTYKGTYKVSVFTLEVDGKKFDAGKDCTAEYTIN